MEVENSHVEMRVGAYERFDDPLGAVGVTSLVGVSLILSPAATLVLLPKAETKHRK